MLVDWRKRVSSSKHICDDKKGFESLVGWHMFDRSVSLHWMVSARYIHDG